MTAIPPDAIEAAARAMRQFMINDYEDDDALLYASHEDRVRKFATVAFTAALGDKYVIVPKEPTNASLDSLALECRATWGVNGREPSEHVPLNFKNEWRERVRPFYRAIIVTTSPAGKEG